MPDAKSKHTAKWDRCVKKVKEKNPNANPYAICSSSIQDAGLKKKYQKRTKSEYYANRKRGLTEEKFILSFDNFVNERYEQSEEEFLMHKRQEIDKEQQYYEKGEELYNKFMEEHDPDIDCSITYIEEWLENNYEPEIFASYIFNKLMKRKENK
ncbi:MAG: hypothetical protein HPY57_15215 [Ignavibacteria bacterium]|nr:hypothetical protein [Ignavibacteria bacterium]